METRKDQRKSRRFRKGLKQKSAIILFCLALTFSPYNIVAEGDDDSEPDDQATEEVAESASDQDEANESEENTTEDEGNREEESDDSEAAEDDDVTEEESEGTEEESAEEADQQESNQSDDANKEDDEEATEASDQEADSSEEGTEEEDESSNTSATEEEDEAKEEESEGTDEAKNEESNDAEAKEEEAKEEADADIILMDDTGDFDDIFVDYGTEREDLELPESITVGVPGFSMSYDIDWNDGEPEYDGNSTGRYLFTGETNAIDSGGPVEPTVTVEVEGLAITEVDSFDTIEVPYGTERGDLEMPDEVEVTLSDGSEMDLGITWSESDPAYDGTEPGLYTYSGDLSLSGAAENPDNLQASVDVEVQNPTVQAVEHVDFIEVPAGISWDDLPLPDEVGVELEDGSWEDVPVEWMDGTNGSEYDPYEIGTYFLVGDLQLPEGIENPDDENASVSVYVQMTEIVDVETFGSVLTVWYGTEKEDVPLPDEVEVTLDNGYTMDLPVTWDEGDPAYDGEEPGLYDFTGTFDVPEEFVRPGAEDGVMAMQSLDPEEHILNPEGLTAELTVMVDPPRITGVTELDPIEVDFGTEAEDIPLPEEQEVVLNDGTYVDLEVNWRFFQPEYDAHAPGEYEVTGNFLGQGLEGASATENVSAADYDGFLLNPEGHTAEVTVIVLPPYITDVETLDPIEVDYGTEKADVPLPEDVEVTLNDGSTTDLDVTWEESTPDYDGQMPDAYEFEGTFDLDTPIDLEVEEMIVDDPVVDMIINNPDDLTATVVVYVNPPYLTDVEDLDPIEVAYGTEEDDLDLPEYVEVTLNDGSTTDLDVNWDESAPDYDGHQPGPYHFTGTFDVPDEPVAFSLENDAEPLKEVDGGTFLTNPEGLTASVMVHVQPPYLTDVEDLDPIEVPYGTEEEDLPVADEVEVTLNDGSTMQLPVTWEESDPEYDGHTPGAYDYTGVFNLPGSKDDVKEREVGLSEAHEDKEFDLIVTNPDGLTASQTVHVLDPLPVAVETFDAIEVDYGTAEDELELPEEAVVTYEDDSEQAFAVDWHTSDPEYDGYTEGTYTFMGTLLDKESGEFSEVTIDVIVQPAPVEEKEEAEAEETLPQTNQSMNMGLYLAGALLILLAMALVVRNRKTGTVK